MQPTDICILLPGKLEKYNVRTILTEEITKLKKLIINIINNNNKLCWRADLLPLLSQIGRIATEKFGSFATLADLLPWLSDFLPGLADLLLSLADLLPYNYLKKQLKYVYFWQVCIDHDSFT